MRTLFLALTFLLSTQVLSAERKVLHLTVNISKSNTDFFATFDDKGDIESFRWKINYADGEPPEEGTFTVEDLIKGEVFKEGLPKKFVKVNAENFSAHQGGHVTVKAPANIILGRYITEEFSYDRVGDEWHFNHVSFDNFKQIDLIVNRAIGIPVGVKSWRFQ
jgi:hypothetical protein